jgi:hypothetical protein
VIAMDRKSSKRPDARVRSVAVALLLASAALLSPAHASAPAGRYTVSNGTVFDTKTKLTWQQSVTATATLNFTGASNLCFGIGSALPGTGWRVPTIKELQTLVDYTVKTAPFIDPGAFPGSPIVTYWSRTEVPPSSPTGSAWILKTDGTTSSDLKTTLYNVRCVR